MREDSTRAKERGSDDAAEKRQACGQRRVINQPPRTSSNHSSSSFCHPPVCVLQVHGGFAVRSFSTSGFPFLNLSSPTPSASTVPASLSASSSHGYASHFLSAAKGGKFVSRATATATAVDATPLPTFPCEKSAVDRTFQQMTANGRERAFFVNDVGVVERQYARWCKQLPNVRPFYAVKCNPDTTLLRTLAGLGAGFDCASADEIAAALSMGVDPSEIIFAK